MSNFSTFSPLMPSLTGTAPQIWIASTNDNLATITVTGYLNDLSDQIKANDLVYINYSDTSTFPLNTGENATIGDFKIIYSASNWSLQQNTFVSEVTYSGALVVGNLPAWNTTTGNLVDSGVVATTVLVNSANNQMATTFSMLLAKGTGTVSTGAVTVNQQSGVITTTALTTAAGASTTIAFTNSKIVAGSVILVSLMGGTNTTVGVQLSCVITGTGTANLIISNNNAGALNGTLIIGFAVL